MAIGCDVQQSDVLGQAYVAPAQLNLRRELSGKSGNVTTLHHGEPVRVLDVRRRFVKIRSAKGMEGWVDVSQLLDPEQMRKLRDASAEAKSMPSQGTATVFEALNIHIDPDRLSPALAKIDEGKSVAVIGHRLAPKATTPLPLPILITEKPQAPARHKKEKAVRMLRLPPPPKPPKPPANWLALPGESRGKAETAADLKARLEAEAVSAKKVAADKKPAVMEDWSRVRTTGGESGWVLSRNLVMAIPDEVAQYAEGRRITSYFDLGSVNDEEKGTKHNWLWTTLGSQRPYDFDSWRVFLWNRHRHRYETSFRQRDVEGYYPVVVDAADAGTVGRTFHLITIDDDGKCRRRTYVFDTVRVHLTNTESYGMGAAPSSTTGDATDKKPEAKNASPNWLAQQWQSIRQRFTKK